jgi:hypothetical protein
LEYSVSDLLKAVDRVYENLNGRISLHWLVDDALADLSEHVRQLKSILDSAEQDSDLKAAISWFRRLSYVLACTPIDFVHALDHCVPPPNDQAELIRRAAAAYPATRIHFDAAGKLVAGLRTARAALPTIVAQLITEDPGKSVAVVVKYQRYVDCVDSVLSALSADRATIITANRVAGLETFDRIVVSGAASWQPAWLRTAPRAPQIDIICPAWINDSLVVTPSLGPDSAEAHDLTARVDQRAARPASRVQAFPAHDLEPRIDAAALVKRAHEDADDQRIESAVLVVLEDQRAVFLSSDDSSDVLCIDLSSGLPEVVHVPAKRLHDGSFVVLRTRGSADYVRDVADSLLGPAAKDARRLQSVWKSALFTRMQAKGTRAVVQESRAIGIDHASIGNVEYWASERGIAMAEKADFSKLLGWLGLAEQLESMWANVLHLRRAHVRAGAEIRDQLENQIKDADADALRTRGRIDFTLPTAGAGMLTAFRVIRATAGTHQVPSSQVGRPFEFDD